MTDASASTSIRMSTCIRLHARLYRAKAIDGAIARVLEDHHGATLTRRREGDYHLVEAGGSDASQALLAEVADIALVATVEQER